MLSEELKYRNKKTPTMKYINKDVGSHNEMLLSVARQVTNASPQPRYKIRVRDEILAMKEKERLGINFNRSLMASLGSRWNVVEKAQAKFLGEISRMNEQLEDDNRKYEETLMNLIVCKTTNLSLDSKMEQLGGLYMHMSYYCRVLEAKIEHYEPYKRFIMEVCELTGIRAPAQLVDRYSALLHIFEELFRDYQVHQTLVNRLHERLVDIKGEISHRNMLMHNQMADLHDTINVLQRESTEMERFIHHQMDVASRDSIESYNIKTSVYHIYSILMYYRGQELAEENTFVQLDEIAVRLENLQQVVKRLKEEVERHIAERKRRRKKEYEDKHLKNKPDEEEEEEEEEEEPMSHKSDTTVLTGSVYMNRSLNRRSARRRRSWSCQPRTVVSTTSTSTFSGSHRSRSRSKLYQPQLPYIRQHSTLICPVPPPYPPPHSKANNQRIAPDRDVNLSARSRLTGATSAGAQLSRKSARQLGSSRCCRSLVDDPRRRLDRRLSLRPRPHLRPYASFDKQQLDQPRHSLMLIHPTPAASDQQIQAKGQPAPPSQPLDLSASNKSTTSTQQGQEEQLKGDLDQMYLEADCAKQRLRNALDTLKHMQRPAVDAIVGPNTDPLTARPSGDATRPIRHKPGAWSILRKCHEELKLCELRYKEGYKSKLRQWTQENLFPDICGRGKSNMKLKWPFPQLIARSLEEPEASSSSSSSKSSLTPQILTEFRRRLSARRATARSVETVDNQTHVTQQSARKASAASASTAGKSVAYTGVSDSKAASLPAQWSTHTGLSTRSAPLPQIRDRSHYSSCVQAGSGKFRQLHRAVSRRYLKENVLNILAKIPLRKSMPKDDH